MKKRFSAFVGVSSAEEPPRDDAQRPLALSAEQLVWVAGGLNPQPLPPIIDRD